MNTHLNRPLFILSFDLELLWGYIVHPQDKMVQYLKNDKYYCRKVIFSLISLLEKYNFPCTWGIVGHLFLDQCSENDCISKNSLKFFKNRLSDPYTNLGNNPLFYGKDIIEKIIQSKVEHEIAYHSFSHIPFTESNSTIVEQEFVKGSKIAEEYGIVFKSFIFPENKIAHIDILKKYGYKTYRGPNLAKKNINKILPIKSFNYATNKIITSTVMPIWQNGIWEIPSSMIFNDRPFFSNTLLFRSKLGINNAIKNNEIVHIFMHPEDLIVEPKLYTMLEDLFKYVKKNNFIYPTTMIETLNYLI